MKNKSVLAASLVVAAMIAGCGSDSSMMSNQAALTGRVADGYLERATVFLDKNGNYEQDANEPFTTTDANGAYTLVVAPADVGRYPIVALALAGVTIDSDSPGVPITRNYLLSIHRQSVSGTVEGNFISPMSTLVRELMETGNYNSMQQAMEDLRVNLGLPPGADVLADYLAGGNVAMHTAAQNMAAVMGGQMSQIFPGRGGGPAFVDVNRYRGMIGSMFSNMSSVRAGASQPTMYQLMQTITSDVTAITSGMPFQNMSSHFRTGMR